MVGEQPILLQLMRAVVAGDQATAGRLLVGVPSLATAHLEDGATRVTAADFYFTEIAHYVYTGDTALHVAAAGYRTAVARQLVAAGADVGARNRRGAEPLHYACDGVPGGAGWDPQAQAATVAFLIEAGADPNSTDASGVAPLHDAVRTRCAAAVSALLEGGADPQLTNRSGSTPLTLALRQTGRGGSGTDPAKEQQREIVRLLELRGATI